MLRLWCISSLLSFVLVPGESFLVPQVVFAPNAHQCRSQLASTTVNSSKSSTSNQFGEENEDISNSDGEKLAKEFYRQLQSRKETPKIQQDESSIPETDEEEVFTPTRKFTGLREPQSLFYKQPSSSSSSGQAPGPQTPREAMMQREFELVGRAEKGLGIQAVLVVVALVFYIYVGLTGGIRSGESAASDDFFLEDEVMPFEQSMPVPSDQEGSYWL